jgi:hypothetical protein
MNSLDPESGTRSSEFGIWNLDFGIWILEPGIWDLKYKLVGLLPIKYYHYARCADPS